jgi:flagellar hook assembly protein FlgD
LAFRSPWPNPSRDAVQLSLALPGKGAVDVDVVDVTGRRVRTLFRGTTGGTLVMRWDGTDDHGHPTPAGIYFARARTAFGDSDVRFVRIR